MAIAAVHAPREAHVPVGPIAIFDGSVSEIVDQSMRLLRTRKGGWIATANLDYVARARRDQQLQTALHGTSLTIADGAPIAWLARFAGARRTQRLAGADLVELLMERSRGLKVAIYGSTPAISGAAAAYLCRRYPGTRVVASITPPFRPLTKEEAARDAEALRESDAELVLVALGCPLQEQVIAEYRATFPAALWIGIGGSLDFYAGRRWRAPRLVQRVGLEWVIRLLQEPRRLWRRYIINDIPALLAVAPACVLARLLRSE